MPAFSGIGQCDVTFDKRGLELLLDMGGGARAASLVKVTPSNCEATVPQITQWRSGSGVAMGRLRLQVQSHRQGLDG